MNDAHPSREVLAAFDRGQLASRDQTEIERHIAGCTSCCQTLESMADDQLVALIKASAATPVASASTVYGGSERADTPAGKKTAVTQIPEPLQNHARYRIVALLGTGGMGAVFRAEHRLMERPVALKILNPELVRRPGAVLRFRQEIKAASQLSHPNIVTAYDADQAGEVHFLVMELVEGKALDQQIDPARPLPVATACSWVRQAACGLAHAHERGMVHRDIKPANLMLAKSPESPSGTVVKILDFGLARFASEFSATKLTASGAMVGTPDYVAPEQAREPHNADIRSDIYSLGCSLYHMLAGRVPHPADTVLQKLMAHQESTPQPLTSFRRDLPPGFVAVLERMMDKDPNQRYQTPAEVIAALTPFSGGSAARGVSGRPPRRLAGLLTWMAILLPVGLLAAGLAYWGSGRSQSTMAMTTQGTAPGGVDQTVPETRSTAPEPQLVVPDNKPARDAAIAWARTHNNFPDKHRFANNFTAQIDRELAKCNALLVTVGPGLLTAKKPMLLALRHGQFHSFELLPEEVKEENERKVGTVGLTHPVDPHRLPEAVQLSGLSLETSRLASGQSIRGTVHYRIVTSAPEAYSLRITAYDRSQKWTITKKMSNDDSTQGSCSFQLQTNDSAGAIAGPVLIYAEVGIDAQVKDGRTVAMTVVSNTLATIAHVEAPAAKPGPKK